MEGNHFSAFLMLREYKHIIDFLTKKRNSSGNSEFHSLIGKMIQKTTVYLNEALQCDAVLLAKMLNPAYQISVFQLWFKSFQSYTECLLQDQFNQHKAEHPDKAVSQASTPPIISQPVPSNHICNTDDVNLFPDASESPADNKLTSYF